MASCCRSKSLAIARCRPDALYVRNVLLDELELALGELPDEQREVFVAHELEGAASRAVGRNRVNVNTLLSRKRYACFT